MNKNQLKERLQSMYDESIDNAQTLGNKFDAGAMHILSLLNREYNLNLDFDTKLKELSRLGDKRYFEFVSKITDRKIKTPITRHLAEMALLEDKEFEMFALKLLYNEFEVKNEN